MTLLTADTNTIHVVRDEKLEALSWYVNRAWPLFPTHWLRGGRCTCGDDKCKSPGKHPLTPNGFKDATLDFETITSWHKRWPAANWATPTGDKGAGVVVVDIDNHKPEKNGFLHWEQLREKHSEPIETVKVLTGGGGEQLYFKYPADRDVPSGSDVLAPGIDVRAQGGYVLIPPSITQRPYTFEFSPFDTEIQELPGWILEKIVSKSEPTAAPVVAKKQGKQTNELAKAIVALNALKQERVDNYDSWLRVGMALSELGDEGLIAWDEWSQKSTKYEPGVCAKKWQTFSNEGKGKQLTLASLYLWAQQDGWQSIPPAPKHPKPSDYVKALESFGYEFSLNAMNDAVYINGQRANEALLSGIEFALRDNEYRSEKDTQVTIYKLAADRPFHPIRDYLTGLIQEGHYDGVQMQPVDHIKRLCSFFEDKDGTFETLLRKWLVGAVGRVLGDHPGQQHPMLVLDGPQGIGKSRFAWWLGSPLPAFYIQSPINPNDKDFLILLCSKFVWEVEELGATLRKADRESLKGFLSKEIINVRKPYGRDEIVKPATASFIGTINNTSGFLGDPTGSRRFRVCTLTKIDWAYEDFMDVNQVWAQAVALYEQGERWQLDSEMNQKMMEINSRYEVDDPLHYDLIKAYNISTDEKELFTATSEIIYELRKDGRIVGGTDNQIAQRIADILTKLGCESVRKRINGQQARVWRGVYPRI